MRNVEGSEEAPVEKLGCSFLLGGERVVGGSTSAGVVAATEGAQLRCAWEEGGGGLRVLDGRQTDRQVGGWRLEVGGSMWTISCGADARRTAIQQGGG